MNFKRILIITFIATSLFILGCTDKREISDHIPNRETQLPNYKVQGPVKAYYEIQKSENQWGGSGNSGIEAQEILLFDQYVIIKAANGSSEVLPIVKIRNLSWK